MCLGIPMRVTEIEKNFKAYAETMGVKRPISIKLVPETKPGDFVLVHAGFAMEKIDPVEARKRIELFEKMLNLEGLD
ncbi:MAG: HypC/HybG/HupF family hydrogenase formation chaperone [Dethiobacter sp.]|nr:MAG: HypC/HybG/HupF family hydrogenase formation chaperone [Dethiobacter sp.]